MWARWRRHLSAFPAGLLATMSTGARITRERVLYMLIVCLTSLSAGCSSDDEWVSQPVRMRLAEWQQFADSCVGKFTATTPLSRAIALELVIADSTGGVEVAPEVRANAVSVGDRFDFLLTESPCWAVQRWQVREQSKR
jgi:hypothetical protein